MVKYNYFETLEQLSDCVVQAVSAACGETTADSKTVSELRKNCDKRICELEDTLFSDFLPPLERDNIAACAHALSRVVDQAIELIGNSEGRATGGKPTEEGAVCIRLSQSLQSAISLLRRIRKPDEIPDIKGFRALLREGRDAHNAMLKKLHAGMLPRSAAQGIILTGRLRAELSHSFDELVEVMLGNI